MLHPPELNNESDSVSRLEDMSVGAAMLPPTQSPESDPPGSDRCCFPLLFSAELAMLLIQNLCVYFSIYFPPHKFACLLWAGVYKNQDLPQFALALTTASVNLLTLSLPRCHHVVVNLPLMAIFQRSNVGNKK